MRPGEVVQDRPAERALRSGVGPGVRTTLGCVPRGGTGCGVLADLDVLDAPRYWLELPHHPAGGGAVCKYGLHTTSAARGTRGEGRGTCRGALSPVRVPRADKDVVPQLASAAPERVELVRRGLIGDDQHHAHLLRLRLSNSAAGMVCEGQGMGLGWASAEVGRTWSSFASFSCSLFE